MNKKIELPVVNVRDVVFYPGMECNLYFGREFSIQAINHAKKSTHSRVVLVTQRSVNNEQPFGKGDTYTIGTVCKVMQSIELTDGSMKAILQATDPVRILKSETRDGIRYVIGQQVNRAKPTKSLIDAKAKNDFLKSVVRWNPRIALEEDSTRFDALKKESQFGKFLDLALEISSGSTLCNGLYARKTKKPKDIEMLNKLISKRQKILEQSSRKKQFSMLLSILKEELHLDLNARS